MNHIAYFCIRIPSPLGFYIKLSSDCGISLTGGYQTFTIVDRSYAKNQAITYLKMLNSDPYAWTSSKLYSHLTTPSMDNFHVSFTILSIDTEEFNSCLSIQIFYI